MSIWETSLRNRSSELLVEAREVMPLSMLFLALSIVGGR
jgi:hypothetical protein